MTIVSARNAPASFLQLQGIVAHLITNARMQHPLGVVSYTPAAFGEQPPLALVPT